MYSCNITAMGIPYNVSVRPRNPAGCGLITNKVCFTIEGGKENSYDARINFLLAQITVEGGRILSIVVVEKVYEFPIPFIATAKFCYSHCRSLHGN